VESLAVADGRAWIGPSDGSVEIVDVSEPRNPVRLGSYPAPQ